MSKIEIQLMGPICDEVNLFVHIFLPFSTNNLSHMQVVRFTLAKCKLLAYTKIAQLKRQRVALVTIIYFYISNQHTKRWQPPPNASSPLAN
jgi:hypothetical protein